MAERVLIVEDDPDVGRLLAYNLTQAGFEVESAATAAEALLLAGRNPPGVFVLDVMLPDLSGVDVCRQIRRDPALAQAGVLMLTARGEDEDRIEGLEAGADDYVVKPFNVREVSLRIRALSRRLGERREARSSRATPAPLSWGALRVDPVTHDVRIHGAEVQLRPLEFKLLVTLLSEPGRVFTREELLTEVWELDEGGGNPRTVDAHVRRLRQNLGGCAAVVETVPGFGYRAKRG